MATTHRALATAFRALHVPGKPLILTNVYDGASARAVADIPATRALATASYAVAASAGTTDDDMTMEQNLAAVNAIAPIAKARGLPLTVDFQDGYGDQLEEGIEKLLAHGVVGINLEDFDNVGQKLFPVETAAQRVKRVLAVATKNGINDFVVNARADPLLHGGTIAEVISRGKAYLDAGATTIFVLGGASTKEDVTELVQAFDGRLNLGFKRVPGKLTIKDLVELGVARISVGPSLQLVAMKHLKEEAEAILSG